MLVVKYSRRRCCPLLVPTRTCADTNSLPPLHYYLPRHLFVCSLFIPPPLLCTSHIHLPSLSSSTSPTSDLSGPFLLTCPPPIPLSSPFVFRYLALPFLVCPSGSVFPPGRRSRECSVSILTLIDHIRCPLSVAP